MTSSGFSGNPTPIFILDDIESWLPVETMQLLAREMQQSETCFLRKADPLNPKHYSIRWFTPTQEEPFCGHAIVAAAIALYYKMGERDYTFQSFSGITTKAHVFGHQHTFFNRGLPLSVQVELPSCPVNSRPSPCETVRANFANALGIQTEHILFLGKNSLRDIVVELDPSVDFSATEMIIDPVNLLVASPPGTRSQIITSKWCGPDVDFAKRVFAHGSEDQATGSTYCLLAPYWGQKLGKTTMKAIQISMRTGSVDIYVKDDTSPVQIKAQGVKSMEGEIFLPAKSLALRQMKAML